MTLYDREISRLFMERKLWRHRTPSFNARSYYRRPNRRLYIGPVSRFGSYWWIASRPGTQMMAPIWHLINRRKPWAIENMSVRGLWRKYGN